MMSNQLTLTHSPLYHNLQELQSSPQIFYCLRSPMAAPQPLYAILLLTLCVSSAFCLPQTQSFLALVDKGSIEAIEDYRAKQPISTDIKSLIPVFRKEDYEYFELKNLKQIEDAPRPDRRNKNESRPIDNTQINVRTAIERNQAILNNLQRKEKINNMIQELFTNLNKQFGQSMFSTQPTNIREAVAPHFTPSNFKPSYNYVPTQSQSLIGSRPFRISSSYQKQSPSLPLIYSI